VEERGGNYIGVEPPSGRTIYNIIRAVELEANNAIRATMKITGEVAGVPVTQRLTLYRGLRRLDIEDTVEWKGPRFVRIEQWFPLEQKNVSLTYGVPFGANAAENIIPKAGTHQSDEIKPDSWRQARHIHDWIHAGTSTANRARGDAADAAPDAAWGLTLA